MATEVCCSSEQKETAQEDDAPLLPPGSVAESVIAELEALEAYLSEDYKRISDEHSNDEFYCSLECHIYPTDDLSECHCSALMRIDIPFDYPQSSLPKITVISMTDLSEKHKDSLHDYLHSKMDESRIGDDLLFESMEWVKEFLISFNYLGAAEDPIDLSTIGLTPTGATATGTEEIGEEDEDDQGWGSDSDDGEFSDEADDWDDMKLTLNEDDIIAHSSYSTQTGSAEVSEESRIRSDRESAELIAQSQSRTKRREHTMYVDSSLSLKILASKLKKDLLISNTITTQRSLSDPRCMAAADSWEINHIQNTLPISDWFDDGNDQRYPPFLSHACSHEGSGDIEVTLAIHLASFLSDSQTLRRLKSQKLIRLSDKAAAAVSAALRDAGDRMDSESGTKSSTMMGDTTLGISEEISALLEHLHGNKKRTLGLQVLGLKESEYLAVRLLFSSNYCTDPSHPKIVAVGRITPLKTKIKREGRTSTETTTKGDGSGEGETTVEGATDDGTPGLEVDDKDEDKEDPLKNRMKYSLNSLSRIKPFMGSFSVRNQLKNEFLPRVWPMEETIRRRSSSVSPEVYQLMEMDLGLSFERARYLIERYKSIDRVLERMADEQERADEGDPGGSTVEGEIGGVSSKCASSASISSTLSFTDAGEGAIDGSEPVIDGEVWKDVSILVSNTDEGLSYETDTITQQPLPKWETMDGDTPEEDGDTVSAEDGDRDGSTMDLPFNEIRGLRKCVEKLAWMMDRNVLARIMIYTLHSTLTLNERCLVCANPHPLSESGIRTNVKPSVCNNRLCQYAFTDMGVGLDLASMILHQSEVVDLLITLCYVACETGRISMFFPRDIIADSAVVDQFEAKKLKRIGKSKKKKKEWFSEMRNHSRYSQAKSTSELKEVLDEMPSVSVLMKWAKHRDGSMHIRECMNRNHPLLYPLLSWLIGTNRSHLRLLTNHLKFPNLPQCWQFEFVTANPESEYRFQKLCQSSENFRGKGNGSLFAWHGSIIGNWHAILRTGLKNMSGTSNMLHGAAFGRGIYLAPRSGTSYWYSGPWKSHTWPLSGLNRDSHYGRTMRDGHGLYVLALCEIVNHPKLKKPEPYYVVPNQEWVITRYLFVFNTIDGGFWGSKGRFFDVEANSLIRQYRDHLRKQVTHTR